MQRICPKLHLEKLQTTFPKARLQAFPASLLDKCGCMKDKAIEKPCPYLFTSARLGFICDPTTSDRLTCDRVTFESDRSETFESQKEQSGPSLRELQPQPLS